ncbi:elongation factor P [Candidatus Dojkabacteria bacterium]|nr:elongation factor P [Candidatus Dojkabacteria bacterium]
MATLSNTDLKNGVVFRDEGEVFSVIKYEHVFKGRGGGIAKLKVRNLKTGSIAEKSYKNNEKVQSVDTSRVTAQFLYSDDKSANFMNDETYEQFQLSRDAIGEDLGFIKEGEKVVILFLEDSPISIEIPKSVELKIEYTEPGVRGDTATNAMKKAKLETGIEINVPLFIKSGEVIKVNTDTRQYVSRVTK